MDNDAPGEFSFIVPFSHIFGLAEYNKVLYNLRHTLTFTRGSDDLPIHRANGVAAGKIVLTDIRWVIPQIIPSVEMRETLLKTVKNKTKIPIHFSSRNDEMTVVTPNVRSFVWKINTSAGVEKPRWVFVGFQTSKTNTQEQNPAVFDHINMTSHSLQMGGERYPSEDTSINFGTNDYVDLCNMVGEYKKEHYGFNNLIGGTQIDMLNYKKLFPIVGFDVRQQSERVRSNVMTMTLDFKFSENVPADTNMYVVIISDRVMILTSDGQTPQIVSN
jgi:hypothetical protein